MEIKRSGSQPSGKGPAEYYTGSQTMAFVDQFLDRNTAQGNCLVPGKGECIFNSLPTLLRSNVLGSVLFAPGLHTFDNNLVDRTKVTALDLFLNQSPCFRFDVDCHRLELCPPRVGSQLHDRMDTVNDD